MTHTNYYLSEQVAVTLVVEETVPISQISQGYVLITVPAVYGVYLDNTANIQISTGITDFAITLVYAGSKLSSVRVDLDAIVLEQLSGLTVSIWGLTNPAADSTSSEAWLIQVYSGNGVLVAQSQSYYFLTLCDPNCRSCLTPSPSSCLSCYSGLYLDTTASTCVPSCSTTQMLLNEACYSCSSSCLTCAGNPYICTSCPVSTFLNPTTGTCVGTCPDHTYSNSSTGNCTNCPPECRSCSSEAVCTYCSDNYLLNSSSNTCISACSANEYNLSNTCVQCSLSIPDCQQCTSGECTLCGTGYLYAGHCLSTCPASLFIDANTNTCSPCQSPCLTCSIAYDNCTTCDATSAQPYLYLSACVSDCPLYTYSDEHNACLDCEDPCLECLSPTHCVSCQPGYRLYADVQMCYSACPAYTIEVGASECQACQSPCLECTGQSTTCTSCIETYYLVSASSTCSTTCTSPYFAIDRQCLRCAPPCSTCANGQPYTCTGCQTGYFLLASTCYTSCPPSTFVSGTSCQVCTSGCYEC